MPTVADALRCSFRRRHILVPGLDAAIGGICSHAASEYMRRVHRPYSSWSHRSEITASSSNSFRWYSPTAPCHSDRSLIPKTKIHIQGDRYGSREYMLLPSAVPPDNLDLRDAEVSALIRKYRIASVRANRNVLFGAKCNFADDIDFIKACKPLVKAALVDAGKHGEQPRALAALDGLCDWVTTCIEREGKGSKVLESILQEIKGSENNDEAIALYEAAKAIATGKPRPGHKVLGAGTFRDGRPLWEKLAREYAEGAGDNGTARESELYRQSGMEVVGIEHLADTSEHYLRTAGGAMASLFFVHI